MAPRKQISVVGGDGFAWAVLFSLCVCSCSGLCCLVCVFVAVVGCVV